MIFAHVRATRDALTLVIQTALDSFDYFFFKFFCWRFSLAALGDDAWPDKKDSDVPRLLREC